MTARRPSGGGGPGIEARAEAPRCAAKAWRAPNSTAQSRPSTASMPGRGAGAFATREAPIMDERACGKGKRLGVIMCVGVCVGLQRSLQSAAFIITMLNLVTWAVPVKRHRGEPESHTGHAVPVCRPDRKVSSPAGNPHSHLLNTTTPAVSLRAET